ncbi:hypothetical protein CIB48_g1148 [Xylaria polymorpha]|nr:hypothetical protein CIB48_g1148 [Xylaria polymorpha]
MSASIPGNRELPESQYDLSTYWGRVRHTASITDPRTLLAGKTGLDNAKKLVMAYKQGEIKDMTPELWKAKKIVDSTIHPDTGKPVLLPFRMSCFALSNLVVTAGMLTPGLSNTGTILWQIGNQSLNVAINNANANKSTPLSYSKLAQSYFLAVGASCSVAVGLNSLVPRLKRVSPSTKLILGRLVPFAAVASAGFLNVFLMRGEEMRVGIDVYPRALSRRQGEASGRGPRRERGGLARQEPQGGDAGRRRDGAEPRAQQQPHHGGPAARPRAAAAHPVAAEQPAADAPRQPGADPRHELHRAAARSRRVPAAPAHQRREPRGGVPRPGRRGRVGRV